MSDERPSITVSSVTKSYGAKEVLKGISLSIDSPGFYSITGASGSGKTTLLSLICGFEKPTSGAIRRTGEIACVFQESNLIGGLTALDNIRIVGCSKEKALSLLKSFGLESLKDTKAELLSGGEKQRISVARCLAMDADFLVLDEPTGSLDQENAISLFEELKRISETRIVLVVTHDLELARRYSDVVYTLEGGLLSSDKGEDTPAEAGDASTVSAPPLSLRKKTLAGFEWKYARTLIAEKKGFFILSVVLFTLTLILEFFSLSFSMYDVDRTVYGAASSQGSPTYALSKSYYNETDESYKTYAYGQTLLSDIEASTDSPVFGVRQFNAESSSGSVTASAAIAFFGDDSELSFLNVSGSLPGDGEVLISDFMGRFLFGSDGGYEGMSVSFPHSQFGDESFTVSGVVGTGFSESDYESFFGDASFQSAHQSEYLSKYMTVYMKEDEASSLLYSSGHLDLRGADFTLSGGKTSDYCASNNHLGYVRASTAGVTASLSDGEAIVSTSFYEGSMESAALPATYEYKDVSSSPNANKYLDVLDLSDVFGSITVVGTADFDGDVALSDASFEKLSPAYLPFWYSSFAAPVRSLSETRALGANGVMLTQFGLIYDFGSSMAAQSTPFWVVSGIVLAVVILTSVATFYSLISRKMHEIAVLRCLGAGGGKFALVFLSYSAMAFSLCFVFSSVIAAILQALLNNFFRTSLFASSHIFYDLLVFGPVPFLVLLATCFALMAIIIVFPVVRVRKVDPAILLKKTV
jgi:ABC-type lipoprotein export system ATPase subunit